LQHSAVKLCLWVLCCLLYFSAQCCHKVSLCLSVSPSRCCVVSKQLNILLKFFHRVIASSFLFSGNQNVPKSESPPTRVINTSWVCKINDFRPINRCISETVPYTIKRQLRLNLNNYCSCFYHVQRFILSEYYQSCNIV